MNPPKLCPSTPTRVRSMAGSCAAIACSAATWSSSGTSANFFAMARSQARPRPGVPRVVVVGSLGQRARLAPGERNGVELRVHRLRLAPHDDLAVLQVHVEDPVEAEPRRGQLAHQRAVRRVELQLPGAVALAGPE